MIIFLCIRIHSTSSHVFRDESRWSLHNTAEIEIFISDPFTITTYDTHCFFLFYLQIPIIMAGVNNNLQFETSKEVTVYVSFIIKSKTNQLLAPRPVSIPISFCVNASILTACVVSRGYGLKRFIHLPFASEYPTNLTLQRIF